MNSPSLQSYYSSAHSLKRQTESLRNYIQTNFKRILLYPLIFDFDYKSYCDHYDRLVSSFNQLSEDVDVEVLKQKFLELPTLNHIDFKFSTFGLPIPILYTILFPVGMIALGRNYVTLTNLQEKTQDIDRILGTAEFMLKAAVS